MKIVLLPILILFFSAAHAQSPDSLQAIKILQQLEAKHRSMRQLTYHVKYQWEDASMQDSIQTSEGTVWLKPKPADTIFSNVFHVSGADKNGAFDYYYDGQKSFEIRHKERSVLMIDPYLFPNNENNPAKARTALNIVQPLLSDQHLIRSLVTHYPYAPPPALMVRDSVTEWVIVLAYPANKYGAVTTLLLHVGKASMQLTRTFRTVKWNGTTQKIYYDIDHADTEKAIPPDSIEVRNVYAGYDFKERTPAQPKPVAVSPLIGRQAAAFTAMTFGGENISLETFKGKYILLDFWETWCGYCIMALPKMKDIYRQYHPKGLEIVGVTTENEKQVAQLIQANHLPYLHAKGNKDLLNKYGIMGRPGYVLIDKTGKIVAYNDIAAIEKILAGI